MIEALPFQVKDRRGIRYGRLVAIRYAGRARHDGALWECQCDCGNTKIIEGRKLGTTPHKTQSCGCLRNEIIAAARNRIVIYRLPPGEAAINNRLGLYKYDAKRRGHIWALEDADVLAMFKQVCHYCGRPPYQTTKSGGHKEPWATSALYTGIDRLDNEQGYTPSNVVPCCGACNYRKFKMGYAEFLDWVRMVYQHLNLHLPLPPE